ncbi:MAG: hypothetical protein RDV48_24450 [Candidatus Eremiobacteraeota bacterium]|nr:hypothetical protein [Candidatus Eremiobacteraeota bacterium]
METISKSEEKTPESRKTLRASPTGLCRACRKAEDCTFPRRNGAKVSHCEEAELPPADPVATMEKFVSSLSREKTRKAFSSALKGLCKNCENAPECVFPKAEGGVWNCEEYR